MTNKEARDNKGNCNCGLEQKVKAKINELREILLETQGQISSERQWVICAVAIPALEDLLNNDSETSQSNT